MQKARALRSVGEGLQFARVQHRQPRVETTEVEAHIATYWFVLLQNQQQVPHRQSKFNMDSCDWTVDGWLRLLQGDS